MIGFIVTERRNVEAARPGRRRNSLPLPRATPHQSGDGVGAGRWLSDPPPPTPRCAGSAQTTDRQSDKCVGGGRKHPEGRGGHAGDVP